MSTINGSSSSASGTASKSLDKLVAQQFLNALNLNKAVKDNTATFQELDDARKQEVKSETKHAEQQTQTIKNPVLNKSIALSPNANLTKDAFTPTPNGEASHLTLAQGKNLVDTVQKSLQLLSAMVLGKSEDVSTNSSNKSATILPNKLNQNSKSTKIVFADNENLEELKESPNLKSAKNAAPAEELEGFPKANTQEYDLEIYSSLRNNFSASNSSGGFGSNINGAISAMFSTYMDLLKSSTEVQLQTAMTIIQTNKANLNYLNGSLQTSSQFIQTSWQKNTDAAASSRTAASMQMFQLGQGIAQSLGGMATQIGSSKNTEMFGSNALETMSGDLSKNIKPVTSDTFGIKAPKGDIVEAIGPDALKVDGTVVQAADAVTNKFLEGSYGPNELHQPNINLNDHLLLGHDSNVLAQGARKANERMAEVNSTDIYVRTVQDTGGRTAKRVFTVGMAEKAGVHSVKDQASFSDFTNNGGLVDPQTQVALVAKSDGSVDPIALDRTLRANGFSSSNDASGVRNITGKIIETQTIIRVVEQTDPNTKQATVTYWASSKKLNSATGAMEPAGASKLLTLKVHETKANQMKAGTASDFSRNHARYEEFDTSNKEFRGSALQAKYNEIFKINGDDGVINGNPALKLDAPFSCLNANRAGQLNVHIDAVSKRVGELDAILPANRSPAETTELASLNSYKTKLDEAYDLTLRQKNSETSWADHQATDEAQTAIHGFIEGTPILGGGRKGDGIKDSDDFEKFQNLAANSEGTKELFRGLAPHSQRIKEESQRNANLRHRNVMGVAGSMQIMSAVYGSLAANQTAQGQTEQADGQKQSAMQQQIQAQTSAVTQAQQSSEGALSQAQQTAGAVAASASSSFAQSVVASATK